jgi:hypothetical protein
MEQSATAYTHLQITRTVPPMPWGSLHEIDFFCNTWRICDWLNPFRGEIPNSGRLSKRPEISQITFKCPVAFPGKIDAQEVKTGFINGGYDFPVPGEQTKPAPFDRT